MYYPIANKNECTGCQVCVDSCRNKALSYRFNSTGYLEISYDSSLCIKCGRCTKVCPVLKPLHNDTVQLNLSKPNAAWSTDNDLRRLSASGGTFSAIAKVFIENAGVVYGASIDAMQVQHIRVDKLKDLPKILGSKYQHSILQGVYNQVFNDLKAGKQVLFCGLSCQVHGLLNFIPSKYKNNLYTIDTICGGISTILPMQNLAKTGKYREIISFRDKNDGWKSQGFSYRLRMQCVNGDIEDLGCKNQVIQSFCNPILKRSSCLNCKFNGFHRPADCTIGDFWGDNKFLTEHKEGLSVLITHDTRIIDFILESSLKLVSIDWEDFIYSNHNYYWTKVPFVKYSYNRNKTLSELQESNIINYDKFNSVIALIDKLLLSVYYKISIYKRGLFLKSIK